jgi:DNA-binding transcriptional LysR family regulator
MAHTYSRFLRSVSFRQLQVFERIALTSSFTEAAKELFLTQPTVSMQVKKLEATIGVALFDQVGRKVFLTPAGEALLETSQKLFELIDSLENKVAAMQDIESGALALAGTTTTEYFIPMLLGIFHQRYPKVHVGLTITDRLSLSRRLAQNMDDLYLMGQLPDQEDVYIDPFVTNPLVVVAHPHHPLAKAKKIPSKKLCEHNFLMREPGSETRVALKRYLDQHGIQLTTKLELNSNEAIKQAVIGGMGLAVLSLYAVAVDAELKRLVILDVEGFPLQESWYLVYPKQKELSPVTQAFLAFVRDEGIKILTQSLSKIR